MSRGLLFLVLLVGFVGAATAYHRAKRWHEAASYDWGWDGEEDEEW